MALFGKHSSGSSSPTPPAMSAETTKAAIIRSLEARELKYTDISDENVQALRLGFTLKNYKGFQLYVFIDNDGESYQIRSGVILSVDDDKRANFLEAINEMNLKYRWMRFYIDNDSDLMAQEDLDFAPTDEKLCSLAIVRAASILDDVYPTFMRAQWA